VTPGLGGVELAVVNRIGAHVPDPDRMFERFYRADPSRSGAAGVGLGLSISRELAAAMGARLSAELADSTLRMRLTLPAG
jgi:signal transduction histidine kinase